MQRAAFRCELLFGLTREPDWSRVAGLIRELHPEAAVALEIAAARGGHALIRFGEGAAIDAAWIHRPSPDPLAPPDHAAHLVLWGEEAEDSAAARIRLARRLTIVAGALALRKDCTGAIWNEVRRLLPFDRVRRAAVRLGRGQDPLTFWIDLVPEAGRERPDGPPAWGLRSDGLAAFFGREIELEPGTETPEAQKRIVGGVLAHAFASGALVGDGEAFRIGEDGDFIARLRPVGTKVAGPVCRIARLAPEPAPAPLPDLPESRTPEALVLFEAGALPDAVSMMKAIRQRARRLGTEPGLRERASDRLLVDWGTLRSLGSRQTEVVHRAEPLAPEIAAALAAQNPEAIAAEPGLLAAVVPVLVREVPPLQPGPPSVPAAMLVIEVVAALVAMAGARAAVWLPAGVLLSREPALAQLRRSESGLPLGFCVGRRPLPAGEGPGFRSRGLAAVGEPDVVMTFGEADPHDPGAVFDALVRGAVFQRSLTRKEGRFVNALDGAEFELDEGPDLLRARLLRAPKPPAGLARLLRPKV
jgi:hypothetical protein